MNTSIPFHFFSHHKKQLVLLIIAVCCAILCTAQTIPIIAYYDDFWAPAAGSEATTICDFSKRDSLYDCKCYNLFTNQLKYVAVKKAAQRFAPSVGLERSFYPSKKTADSILYDAAGNLLRKYHFYENGCLADRVIYSQQNSIDSALHYYANGNKRAQYAYNRTTKKSSTVSWDSTGIVQDTVLYYKGPKFKNGSADWTQFVNSTLDASVPALNHAPPGRYKAMVQFQVEKDGSISHIAALTQLGYGIENEVIRLIRKSPNWAPALFLGNAETTTLKLPVTFIVE